MKAELWQLCKTGDQISPDTYEGLVSITRKISVTGREEGEALHIAESFMSLCKIISFMFCTHIYTFEKPLCQDGILGSYTSIFV